MARLASSPRPRATPRSLLLLLVWSALSLGACGKDEDEVSGGADEPGGQVKSDGGKTPPRDAGRDASRPPTSSRDGGISKPPVITDPDTCAAITAQAPALRGKVDIVWVVDNSPSMFDKVAAVAANINNFFTSIQNAGADTHVLTITIGDLAAGTALGGDASKYRFVPSNVWSKLLYTTTLGAFSTYQDFLRADAATHFIMVSDDDDLVSGADFKAQMEELLGHPFTQHAITAQQFGCGAAIGQTYMSCADLTMGKKISVCSADWTQVFGDLTAAVIETVPLPCSYDLAEAATAASDYDPSEVQVVYTPDGSPASQELPKSSSAIQCGDKAGWFYDDEANPKFINLCPAACETVKAGGAMDIAFGCEPTIFL